jgi:hypothetical protein
MTKKDGYDDFLKSCFEQLDTLEASARQRTIKSKVFCEHDRPMWEPCRKCRRYRSGAESWFSKFEKNPHKLFEEET